MDKVNVSLHNSNRDATIDIIKGFAIVAVVLLHINFSFPKIGFFNSYSIFGGLWHVAVFFVVSGWFLKDNRLLNFKTFAKGKVINLYFKAMYVYIPLVLLHNFFLEIGCLYDDINYNHGLLSDYTFVQTLYHVGYQFLFTQREPFSGAMWFVDSLFFGLIFYSLITIMVFKYFNTRSNDDKRIVRFIICFCLAFMSAALRDVCGLNIPKISNTLSALVLICVGQFLGQMKLKFDNLLLLLVAFVIFIQYTVLTPSVALNGNKYKDVVFLIVSSVSALYVIGGISKKLSHTYSGRVIEYIGKESFWIMGFHMVGFHIFTLILTLFGLKFEHHFTTPQIGYNVFLLLGYVFCGVGVPLLIRYICYNKIYTTFLKKNI